MRLSPAALTAEIVKAGIAARTEDARAITETRDALHRAIGRVDGIVERGQAADAQVRRRGWSAVAGAVAGMLVWAVLPGMVARALPARWHVPEWMAARTLRVDQQIVDRDVAREPPN